MLNEAQTSPSNCATPAQHRDANAPLPDGKHAVEKDLDVALEKDSHVRLTSSTKPPLPVPAIDPVKQVHPRSLISRGLAYTWKALVFSLNAYVVLVVITIIYTLVVDAIVPATKATWTGLEIASSWVEYIFFPICCMLFLFWHWVPAPAARRRGPRLPTEVPTT